MGCVLKDRLEEKVNAAQAQKQMSTKGKVSPSKASLLGSPGGSMVKNPPADIGHLGSIPGLGRSPGGGNGNLLQYSCLENPVDRGDWRAIVHGTAKSWT